MLCAHSGRCQAQFAHQPAQRQLLLPTPPADEQGLFLVLFTGENGFPAAVQFFIHSHKIAHPIGCKTAWHGIPGNQTQIYAQPAQQRRQAIYAQVKI
jgi:hypothetical protein